MKKLVLAATVCCSISLLTAATPKTDVVIETKDGILLHVEYVSEKDGTAVVDIRAALMPASLCEEKDFPQYIPKGKLKNPTKMTTGHCLYSGKPFVTRSTSITAADIKKRYDSAMITLSAGSEKKQLPYFGVANGHAWGFNLTPDTSAGGGNPPGPGLQAFPFDSRMDTIQVVDVGGSRTTLYPATGFWAKYRSLEPRVSLNYVPLMPTGNISLLNFGALGIGLETSVQIPEMKFLPLKKYSLRLRGGLAVSYHSFSQDLFQNGQATTDGKITLLPVMAQLTLYWDLKPKSMKMTISPYFRLADGVIFSTVNTSVKSQYLSLLAPGAESSRSGSYIGNGFAASLGVEVRPNKWPVSFYLDGGYMMHAQDLTGSYFAFNAGASYWFGAPAGEPKMLPVHYIGQKSVALNLKGTVKEPDGDALAGAAIVVRAKGSTAVVKEVAAGDKGQFSVELEPGLEYEVQASKDGYVKSVLEISMLSNDKKTRDHEFILAPMTYSLEGVNFKPDSDELLKGKGPEKALMELVKFLKANPGLRIEIGGHTAASGADDENSRKLSKKRAERVRKFIISKGIEEGRLTSEGYGGSAPIADGKTAAGAAKNRRVEVKILTE